MDSELFVKRITLKANLEKLASKINAAQWDEGNALLDGGYTADSLERYLRGEGNFFFACFIGSDLAGMASAQLLPRAYGKHSTLYVDELDTAVNFRRRGVATSLMTEIKQLAEETNSCDLWLGTEKINTSAQTLYEKLAPDCVEELVGYTWHLEN